MTSGIPQEKRAALWARFYAGVVSQPNLSDVQAAAECADLMLAEYEKRYQTVETGFGAELSFGLRSEQA